MELETENLLLREFTLDDVDAMYPILSHPEVMRFSLGVMSRQQVGEFIQRCLNEYEEHGFGPWAIIDNNSEKIIGYCGIKPQIVDDQKEIELGYRLAREYWGQGYGVEAALACRDHATQHFGLQRLIAIIEPANTRSINLIEKLNFIYEKDTIFKGFSVRIYTYRPY